MPHATAQDDVRLYYEEAGDGFPIIFSHEFAGDYRSWEAQMRFFSRRYRCITYSARGYPKSDVLDDPKAYSQDHARDDIIAVLDHLGIDQAYVVGLSMGAYAALQIGLTYPDRTRGLVVAAGGSGSEPDRVEEFRALSRDIARQFEEDGAATIASTYGQGAARVQFMSKDPRGYAEFAQWISEHPPTGSAHTSRGFQASRASLWEYQDALRELAVPTLIVVGDEDEPCLRPSLYLKRQIPAAGLVMFPKTGHCVSQEEPELFNRTLSEFFDQVEAGRWTTRDPRAAKLAFPGLSED